MGAEERLLGGADVLVRRGLEFEVSIALGYNHFLVLHRRHSTLRSPPAMAANASNLMPETCYRKSGLQKKYGLSLPRLILFSAGCVRCACLACTAPLQRERNSKAEDPKVRTTTNGSWLTLRGLWI